MLLLFHTVMFGIWVGLSVPAISAAFNGRWIAAAVWGALALFALAIEVSVARILPRLLGRDPYE